MGERHSIVVVELLTIPQTGSSNPHREFVLDLTQSRILVS